MPQRTRDDHRRRDPEPRAPHAPRHRERLKMGKPRLAPLRQWGFVLLPPSPDAGESHGKGKKPRLVRPEMHSLGARAPRGPSPPSTRGRRRAARA